MIKSKKCKRYQDWRKAVFERDNYTCQHCGITKDEYDREFHAHHIKKWKDFFELRVEVSNGQTLCHVCHHRLHYKERAIKPITEETREKLRIAKLGKPGNKKGKKVGTVWNKGLKTGIAPWKEKTFDEQHKRKLSDAKKKFLSTEKGKETMSKVWEDNRIRCIIDNPSKHLKGSTWVIDELTGKRKWINITKRLKND